MAVGSEHLLRTEAANKFEHTCIGLCNAELSEQTLTRL